MERTAQLALEALIDPSKPYVYIICVPTVALVALGRGKLALIWAAVMSGILFFA